LEKLKQHPNNPSSVTYGFQTTPNEEGIASVWMLPPPQWYSLLFFDHHPLTVLLHRGPDGSGVVWVFEDELLLFETSNDLGAAIKDWVAARVWYSRKCQRF